MASAYDLLARKSDIYLQWTAKFSIQPLSSIPGFKTLLQARVVNQDGV
jgi:hypothetical protein